MGSPKNNPTISYLFVWILFIALVCCVVYTYVFILYLFCFCILLAATITAYTFTPKITSIQIWFKSNVKKVITYTKNAFSHYNVRSYRSLIPLERRFEFESIHWHLWEWCQHILDDSAIFHHHFGRSFSFCHRFGVRIFTGKTYFGYLAAKLSGFWLEVEN